MKFHRMFVAAWLFACMYCTTALQKRQVKGKLAAIPQYDSSAHLILESPHTRYDATPINAADGAYDQYGYMLLSDVDDAEAVRNTTSHSNLPVALVESEDQGRRRRRRRKNAIVDGDIVAVRSEFIGKGVWRRHDVEEVPDHALIWTPEEAVTIIGNAATSAGEETDTSGGTAVYAEITSSSQKAALTAAASTINGHGVNSCSHDVWVSAPIGYGNGRRRRRKVFAPGMNMMWLTLNPSRNEMLGYVVVGAGATSSPGAVYPGLAANNYMEATMSFVFSDFSNVANPIKYAITFDSQGRPELDMLISHYENNVQYGNFKASFATSDESVFPKASKFHKEWRKTEDTDDFSQKVFIDKALQVYEICHCYHFEAQGIYDCLMSDGKKSDVWREATAQMLKLFADLFIGPWDGWTQRPWYQKRGGAWRRCWEDITPNEFEKAFKTAVKTVKKIDEVSKEIRETSKKVGRTVRGWFGGNRRRRRKR